MAKTGRLKNLIKDGMVCMCSVLAMALITQAAYSYGAATLAKQKAIALAEMLANTQPSVGEIKSEQRFTTGRELAPEMSAPADMEDAEVLIEFAKQYVGVRYIYGGKTPAGFDCSGFVGYVFRNCGYNLNGPCAKAMLNEDCEIIDRKYLNPGDLIFCGRNTDNITHVGIYIGNHEMIHAGTNGIVIVNIDEPYWVGSICCYGRPLCYEMSESIVNIEEGK